MTPTPQAIANPYVGPRTFTREQRHLYFGREREAQDLLARVLSERLVLFYAQSGAGKSSLINTRLIPDLWEAGYAALPVARVGGEVPAGVAEVDNVFLFNLMLSLDQLGDNAQRLAGLSLSQFLAGLSSEDGEQWAYIPPSAVPADTAAASQPYVLIVDQFEEIITGHPGRWEERAEFFRQLNQAMLDDPDLWVVLTLREDYIAPIEPYAPLMADRMRARFYMERMGEAAALDAVRKPAEMAELGDRRRPFAPGVAEQLVDNLRQVRIPGQAATIAGQYVEPVQLQVVCYQLWENLERGTGKAGGPKGSDTSENSNPSNPSNQSDQPTPEITLTDLAAAGDVDQALTQFYEETLSVALVDPAAAGISERQLRAWFDEELITEAGTRGFVHQGEQKSGGLPNGLVRALQKRFLVRAETRGGDAWIELVHDRFVEPIRANNSAWFPLHLSALQRQAALWDEQGRSSGLLLRDAALAEAEAWAATHPNELASYEQEFLAACREAQNAAERERRQSRRIRMLAVLAGAVAVLAVIAAGVALDQTQSAQQMAVAAMRAELNALDSQSQAVIAQAAAEEQTQLAEDRTEIARMLLGVQRDFVAQVDTGGVSVEMLKAQRQRLEQGEEVLASGVAPTVTLPVLTGVPYADAQVGLNGACRPEPCLRSQVRWELNDEVAGGLVLQSEPPAGAKLLWGTAVTLTVSQGEPIIIETPVRMEFIPVPSGKFPMGSDSSIDPEAFEDEKPQQPVDLPEFYIGKYEVTNAQYEACVKAGKCEARWDWEIGTIRLGEEDHPVVNVSWHDAVAFTTWLSAETGQAFRLPTEAEWEKACRGITGLIYPWRSRDIGPGKLNYKGNIDDTKPVGSYSPNGDSSYGAADMAGNVWEWTSSQYKAYPYRANDGREDLTGSAFRVLRSGSFQVGSSFVRCAGRTGDDPGFYSDGGGFRVGFTPPAASGL